MIIEHRQPRNLLSPHFSQAFYCGVAYRHVYGVALGRAPRHTVKYACGALRRAPCIHACLHRLATKSREKCGLGETHAHVLDIGSNTPGFARLNLDSEVEE